MDHPADRDAAVQSWVDHNAIRTLTARYDDAFDDGRATDFAATFTADGALVVGGQVTAGTAALVALVDQTGPGTVHITTDPVIQVSGDHGRQRCRILMVRRMTGTASATLLASGRYEDDLVRQSDGSWLFARRTVTLDVDATG